MNAGRHPSSYRDPSGFLFLHDGTLYRYVAQAYAPHYDTFMQGGLYRDLTGAALLIPHREVPPPTSTPPGAHRILKPEPVAFVSYPYEWCFGQLRDAALCLLEVQRRALMHGMLLKDASAYNVQFHRGRPIWIDTLSFERYRPGEPWIAYRQFCEHFLAPLLLMARLHVDAGRLLREHLDGLPLDLAVRMLGWRAAFSSAALVHVRLHARSIRKFSGPEAPSPGGQGRVGLRGLEALVDNLTRAVRNLDWRPSGTEWADYSSTHGYAPESLEAKRRIVQDLLAQAQPQTVWDLGANTGEFSRLAAATGAATIALDADAAAVERNYQRIVSDRETGILPLIQDLSNPSPSLGWGLAERLSLVERGPADVVLALALVHHLAITHNLPFDLIAGFLAKLGRQLIIEFVPKDDPQLGLLLRSREDIFTQYSRESFERAFERWFSIGSGKPLPGSGRILYSMTTNAS
jgi:ribosomal protein L11 methylase PrmA